MTRPPIIRAFLGDEVIADSFAGGGGASTGIEIALGRSPDIAINHSAEARGTGVRVLRPFWRYYGGKWRVAPRYPAPRFGTVIEPFAGAAGYSLRHHTRKVVVLASWCRSRTGQVIACEADGATWLPFRSFGTTSGVSAKRSHEAVWLSDEAQLPLALPEAA